MKSLFMIIQSGGVQTHVKYILLTATERIVGVGDVNVHKPLSINLLPDSH